MARRGRRDSRTARPARPPAERAVWRSTAARRGRPRGRDPTGDRVRGRADRKPRLTRRRRDPRLPAPRSGRPRPDRRDGHARPGRRVVRGCRRLPRRRPRRRPDGRPDGRARARPHQEPGRLTMFRLSLTSLWARKRRMLGTGIAVVIGVAFLVGTLVLGDTLKANFDRLFTEVSAGTDVVVRNRSSVATENASQDDHGLLPQSLVRRVRGVDGVADAHGQVVGYGSLLGKDGDAIGGNGPPRLAGSWVTDASLNPYRLVDGRAPRADDEVVINRGAAEIGDLHVGDTTTLQSPQPVSVRIVGIATFGSADGLGQTTFTAFTLAGAQEHVTGQPGQVSNVVVRAEPGVSDAVLRDRIASVLPRSIEAITGQQLTDERIDSISSTFLDLLRAFLVVFAGIALIVATLSINNTFTITVAQRTRELALMRAVGASRRQVRASVAVEGLVIGAVSAAIGAVAGLGVAGLLKGLFDSFGFSLPAGGLTVNASALLIGFAAGTVATFVAAQLPARRASKVAPLAALQQSGAEASGFGVRRVLVGVGILAAGAIGAAIGAATGAFLPAGLGGFALVVGALLVAPVLVPPISRMLGGALRRTRGGSRVLAGGNARRDPPRGAAAGDAPGLRGARAAPFPPF